MASASQMLESISAYKAHGDVDRFVEDFSALSYNIHKHGNAEAIRLSNEIESLMADLRGKFISKSVFDEALSELTKPFASSYVMAVTDICMQTNQLVVLGTSSRAGWLESFGTLPGAVFASADHPR